MDKQLIERIALEEAGEYGLETAAALTDFAERFLARIDAERGKAAVAWRLENGIGGEPCLLNHKFFSDMKPLFLSPTIPEGMAKDAKRYRELKSGNYSVDKFVSYSYGWTDVPMAVLDETLDAAQGERNAD